MTFSTDSAPRGADLQVAFAATERSVMRLPPAAPLRALMSAAPAPLDFVLPGFVRGTVGAFVGPGGLGKSFWAMQLAVSMAVGVDLVGVKPKQGTVLYLSGEDAETIHAQRLLAMTAGAPEGLNLSAALDLRVVLEEGVDLMVEAWFDEVVAAARGKDLVVLDTLTRFHNLDENSARDMKQLLARLERLARTSGAAVMYLHHASKASVTAGLGATQQAARGSSVLVDNARWACFLAPMSAEEGRRLGIPEARREAHLRWNISKQNYAASIPDVWYERMAGGVLRVLDAPTGKAAAAEVPGRTRPSKQHHLRNARKTVTVGALSEQVALGLVSEGASRAPAALRPVSAPVPIPESATNAFQNKW